MIKIKFSVFVYLHKKSNSVMVRVRWDNKKEEVTFATHCRFSQMEKSMCHSEYYSQSR